jgi:hypothetical protein
VGERWQSYKDRNQPNTSLNQSSRTLRTQLDAMAVSCLNTAVLLSGRCNKSSLRQYSICEQLNRLPVKPENTQCHKCGPKGEWARTFIRSETQIIHVSIIGAGAVSVECVLLLVGNLYNRRVRLFDIQYPLVKHLADGDHRGHSNRHVIEYAIQCQCTTDHDDYA